MTAGNGVQSGLRLKAKEKVLVQLYLHRCEADEGVFPFEVTQKGLSEHLGLRRSHVAVALQELIKDGFVDVVKGHVEGADRRQNAYCITPKGVDSAAAIRERLLEVEVSFEDAEGTRTIRVSEIVNSRKASLASVIVQLDRGGPVRDEITVMTTPERKLISVFCPTCKKQIEVDNIFIDEEVGFDCPGCGRPYRIVPALQKEPATEETYSSATPKDSRRTAVIALAALFVVAIISASLPASIGRLMLAGAGMGIVIWILLRWRRRGVRRPRTMASAIAYTISLSPVLLLVWHFTVVPIDPMDTATVVIPILAALSAAYIGVRIYLPEFKGDYLLSSGLVLILIAAATMILVDFGEIDVGMALIVGISGGCLVVLYTFHPVDRDAAVLDGALSVGAFLLLLTGVVLVWESSETVEYVATGSVVLLGTGLVGLRIAREWTGARDLSSHLVAALPLTFAVSLFALGVLLLKGGAVVAGLVELAAAVPFAYFGQRQVFNTHWPYRVPIVVFFLAVLLLALTSGLLT